MFRSPCSSPCPWALVPLIWVIFFAARRRTGDQAGASSVECAGRLAEVAGAGDRHMIAGLFVPLLIPLATGRALTLDDLANLHLPLRYLYWSALHNGDSVLWTSALFAGFDLHGEGQVGMAHPFHFLIYRLLPLDIAYNFELIANYVGAVAGMCLPAAVRPLQGGSLVRRDGLRVQRVQSPPSDASERDRDHVARTLDAAGDARADDVH